MNQTFNKTPMAEIAHHVDGLTTLRALVDLVQNPQPLLDAHDRARQEAQLTDEQRAKYDDAVVFISESEQMADALTKRAAALKSDEEAHTADVESFNKWRYEEIARLEKQKDDQEVVQRTQDARATKLNDLWKDMQGEYSKLVSPLDDVKAQNEKDAAANEKENHRLKLLALKLAGKSARLKKTLDEDDEEEKAA